MLFLGVDVIDLERDISTHNENEARSNRRMCEIAERIVVVADSSKSNRFSLYKTIDTQHIDTIIIDEGIPADSPEDLRKAGAKVTLVGELASSLRFTMLDEQALSGMIQLDV